MKAIVCEKYGAPSKVLQLKDVNNPVPGDDQILIQVMAASVNVSNAAPIRGSLVVRLFGTGLLKPNSTRPGSDVAGVVEAVGKNATQFKPGDEVFGAAPGAYAEYALAKEDGVVLKPANITFEEASSVAVGGISALQGLRAGRIQVGQKVLIYGASGAVGTFAVQIAKWFGTEVTAVCSPRNVEQTRSLGADHVIDYTQEDVTQGDQKFDLILAVNGAHSMADYKRILKSTGSCVVVGGKMSQIFQGLLAGPVASKKGAQRIGFMGIAKLNQKDLAFLKELLESGKTKAVIDRRYPLSETGKAMEYIEAGHARGKVVISVQQD